MCSPALPVAFHAPCQEVPAAPSAAHSLVMAHTCAVQARVAMLPLAPAAALLEAGAGLGACIRRVIRGRWFAGWLTARILPGTLLSAPCRRGGPPPRRRALHDSAGPLRPTQHPPPPAGDAASRVTYGDWGRAARRRQAADGHEAPARHRTVLADSPPQCMKAVREFPRLPQAAVVGSCAGAFATRGNPQDLGSSTTTCCPEVTDPPPPPLLHKGR
jgi:hypothetical protein